MTQAISPAAATEVEIRNPRRGMPRRRTKNATAAAAASSCSTMMPMTPGVFTLISRSWIGSRPSAAKASTTARASRLCTPPANAGLPARLVRANTLGSVPLSAIPNTYRLIALWKASCEA